MIEFEVSVLTERPDEKNTGKTINYYFDSKVFEIKTTINSSKNGPLIQTSFLVFDQIERLSFLWVSASLCVLKTEKKPEVVPVKTVKKKKR